MVTHLHVYFHCSFTATLGSGKTGRKEAGQMDDQTAAEGEGSVGTATDERGNVTVAVNHKPVTLPKHRVTGLEIKRAAIAQGVEIEEDFLLTEEAHDGHDARTVPDDKTITVTKRSVFTANDVDDDS